MNGLKNFHYTHPHPAVTTDVVLFSIREARLELPLVRRTGQPFAGMWGLPGGFVGGFLLWRSFDGEDGLLCAFGILEGRHHTRAVARRAVESRVCNVGGIEVRLHEIE